MGPHGKPSINGRAARLWTECTQPGDCLAHRNFQQIYVRAAAEQSLSGTPMHLLFVDAPNRAIPMDENFLAGLEPLRARLFVPSGRDIASFRAAMWPYGRHTE